MALHGAGGDEHFFFEIYGSGLAPRMAAERGYAFISPGYATPSEDFMAIVADVKPWIAPDADMLIIIGHSLGGESALQFAQRAPAGVVSAIAVLSAGISGRPGKLHETPIFLSWGKSDLLREPARKFHQRLNAAGVEVTCKEYEADHILLVTESLPDLFTWIDTHVRSRFATDCTTKHKKFSDASLA